MADESSDYAGRRAVMDCQAIGEPLPPIKQTVADELIAAEQHIRLAAGRLRTAETLQPDYTLDLLTELLDSMAAYLILQASEERLAAKRTAA